MTGDTSSRDDARAALEWAVHTCDPEFDDWDALAAWTQGDPVRNRLYDTAMDSVTAAVDALRIAIIRPGAGASVSTAGQTA